MEKGKFSPDSIPIDLIAEICSRLPAKSIARFRCVSKLWGSILNRSYFTELFLTMSQARPRILLGIKPDGHDPWQFYLLPQPQVPYEKSSSLLAPADFHMEFPSQQFNIDNNLSSSRRLCGYASGLICFSGFSMENGEKLVIYNLSTGQYVILPKLTNYNDFLGFDPIEKQFKVLAMAYDSRDDPSPHILTLRSGKMSWRKIKCPLAYASWHNGICINGVLYYLVNKVDRMRAIVCFDVRSEKFKFITPRYFDSYSVELINYKGKLGTFSWKQNHDFELWVLEDVEKQEWSKYAYTLPKNKRIKNRKIFVAGVTTTGEIVLSMYHTHKRFYVFYFNPERNTLQAVEIPGNHQVVDETKRVYIFVDHVEDLKFNIRNATSIIPPEQKQPTSTSTSSKKDHHKKQDRRQ